MGKKHSHRDVLAAVTGGRRCAGIALRALRCGVFAAVTSGRCCASAAPRRVGGARCGHGCAPRCSAHLGFQLLVMVALTAHFALFLLLLVFAYNRRCLVHRRDRGGRLCRGCIVGLIPSFPTLLRVRWYVASNHHALFLYSMHILVFISLTFCLGCCYLAHVLDLGVSPTIHLVSLISFDLVFCLAVFLM